MKDTTTQPNKRVLLLIIVAALGYFVDIYDLVLFNVVKKESLLDILPNLNPQGIKSTGVHLFNVQMLGMLIGGVLWGVLGDKKGRLSVLFGSILLYSTANIANAFVTGMEAYTLVRLIAGIGLAGELGAGITLVSETMDKKNRGWGTMIIVSFGALGAVFAAIVGAKGYIVGNWLASTFNITLQSWQVTYIVGGVMGLMLLLLRVGTIESGMYKQVESTQNVSRGNILALFKTRATFIKYLRCILVGVPIWYVIGLLINNSQEEFAPAIGVSGAIINGEAVKYAYIGLCVGDIISGLLSQLWGSRKKVVLLYLALNALLIIAFLFFSKGISPSQFYFLCFLLGMATGYWAIFVTIAAEQFGTNIRSTVANTVPNFVRGSVNIITLSWGLLIASSIDSVIAAAIVGVVCVALALWAIWGLDETFAKELDYVEQIA